MPCDQLPLLQRLAVESPSQLQTQPWQEHMGGCAECRMENQALEGTLAVFKQIEGEGRMQKEFGPSWEAFSLAVEQADTAQPIHRQMASGGSPLAIDLPQAPAQAQKSPAKRRWRLMTPLASMASVATVAATVIGVILWQVEPLPEPPREEAFSAAPRVDRAPGMDKFSQGVGKTHAPAAAPAMLPPPQPVGRSIPIQFPVVREFSVNLPSFGQHQGRGGTGGNPAPVILFRSLQTKKSLGMDKPAARKPAGRVFTRRVAQPIQPKRKARAAKTLPGHQTTRPVAIRSKGGNSLRRMGGRAEKSSLAVQPTSSPAVPLFSPNASSGPLPPRPLIHAKALPENLPAAEPSSAPMMAPFSDKSTLQAMFEAEELAETDTEAKMEDEDFSLQDPESWKKEFPVTIQQAANVAP